MQAKMELRSDISFQPLLGFEEGWDPSSRLALNNGTICQKLENQSKTKYRDGLYYPKDDWHAPTQSELGILLNKSAVDLSKTVCVFKIPELLRARFWELDIENLFSAPGSAGPKHTKEYQDFITEIIQYLESTVCHVSPDNSFTTVVNLPGLKSTTYDPEFEVHIGLHFDNFDRLPVDKRHLSPMRAGINLGDEPRYLLLINLTAMEIFNMLNLDHTPENYQKYTWASPLGNLFMTTFPEYPVVKLTLNPGEGYLAPTQNAIHDGYTLGRTEPDVNLLIRANFSLH